MINNGEKLVSLLFDLKLTERIDFPHEGTRSWVYLAEFHQGLIALKPNVGNALTMKISLHGKIVLSSEPHFHLRLFRPSVKGGFGNLH